MVDQPGLLLVSCATLPERRRRRSGEWSYRARPACSHRLHVCLSLRRGPLHPCAGPMFTGSGGVKLCRSSKVTVTSLRQATHAVDEHAVRKPNVMKG